MSELYMFYFHFFQLASAHFPGAVFFPFHISRSSARNYRAFEKIDILFYGLMNKHVFLNFVDILYTNKKMVSFFQLHSYNFVQV